MSTVDKDIRFRERLAKAYQVHNLGKADHIIYVVNLAPAKELTSIKSCIKLLFGLELWAACFGHPHPAIAHIGPIQWRMWRHATQPEDAVAALTALSNSPLGAEFAEDSLQLRTRLLAIAQKYPSKTGA